MNLSHEWKLILACARTNIDWTGARLIRKLTDADLDWDYVAKTSCSHGIAPLVYHSLHRSGVTSLMPSTPAQRLRSAYYGNAARNTLLYDQLRAVLTMLGEQSRDVIVLKGAALAETVYPHRALRPMSDIDLLVKKERLAEIEAKLLEMGYVLDERVRTKEWRQAHHYHLVFVNGSGIPVEVHWDVKRPEDPSGIDIAGFWKRARSLAMGDVQTLVLSPADFLIHLCQHLWKHKLMGGIRPLCDIAEVLKAFAAEIDWPQVARLSSQSAANSSSYVGFWHARELLDAPVPESFMKDIKPVKFNPDVLGWVRERLLAHGESSPVFPDLLQLFWKGRSNKQRWATLQRTLSPKAVAGYSGDTLALKKARLYYPLRIKHLLTRYGPLAFGLVAGNRKIREAAEKEENQLKLTKWLSSV